MPRNRRGTQPIRVPTGGDHGSRQQLEAAQRAQPLPASENGGGGGAQPQQRQPGPVSRPDVFGPSSRPAEPLTAGASAGPGSDRLGILPDDPAEFLRAVYMQFPSPGLARLLEKTAGAGPQGSIERAVRDDIG